MRYEFSAIADADVPRARVALLQRAIDTYASETNKVISVWASFDDASLGYRPHPRSTSVGDIMKHQLLSERRFFGEFLGTPEPAPGDVLPNVWSVENYKRRMLELAWPRLGFMAERDQVWWQALAPFFDAKRERVWIFWRRVLHTAHHRTQLTVPAYAGKTRRFHLWSDGGRELGGR